MVADPNISDTDKALQRMFPAALLLTGSIRTAEEAVRAAVNNTDGFDISGDTVFNAMLLAATSAETIPELDADLCGMPEELRVVVLLAPELRHAFVLRVLLRRPVSQCSLLLSIDSGEVERNTVAALMALAALRERDGGFATCHPEIVASHQYR